MKGKSIVYMPPVEYCSYTNRDVETNQSQAQCSVHNGCAQIKDDCPLLLYFLASQGESSLYQRPFYRRIIVEHA